VGFSCLCVCALSSVSSLSYQQRASWIVSSNIHIVIITYQNHHLRAFLRASRRYLRYPSYHWAVSELPSECRYHYWRLSLVLFYPLSLVICNDLVRIVGWYVPLRKCFTFNTYRSVLSYYYIILYFLPNLGAEFWPFILTNAGYSPLLLDIEGRMVRKARGYTALPS